MLTQVTNVASQAPAPLGQPTLMASSKPQKPAAPVELPGQAVQAVEKIDIGTVKQAADQINALAQQFNRNLQFTVDDDTGINVVQVIDTETEEVIRQIPTEEILAIAKALDKLQGLLIKEHV